MKTTRTFSALLLLILLSMIVPVVLAGESEGDAAVRPDIASVVEELRLALVGLSTKYPEMVEAKNIRIKGSLDSTPLYGFDYFHNCKLLGKRGYEETGPNAVHVGIGITTLRRDFIFAHQSPAGRWSNLNLEGFQHMFFGKNASPGLTEEITRILQQAIGKIDKLERAEREDSWGEAVGGLQSRLHCDKLVWNMGESPVLKLDLRNVGEKDIYCANIAQQCEIEYDGKWYGWRGPRYIDIISARLKPGKESIDCVQLKIPKSWAAKMWGTKLKLTKGKHVIRVRYKPTPFGVTKSDPAVSNSVEIEILPNEKPALQVDGITDGLFPGAYELESSQTVSAYHKNIVLELHNKKKGHGEIPSSIVLVRSVNKEIALKIDGYEALEKITYKIPKRESSLLCVQNPDGGNSWNGNQWHVISLEKDTFLKNLGKVSQVKDVDKDGVDELVKFEDIWEDGLGWFSHAGAPGAKIYYKIENGNLVPDAVKNMKYWNSEIKELDKQIYFLSRQMPRDATTDIVDLMKHPDNLLLHAMLEKFLCYRLLGEPEKGWGQLSKDLIYYDDEYFFFTFTAHKSDKAEVKTGKFPIREIEETIRKSLEQEGLLKEGVH